jgi:hypothetical protein
MKGASFILIRAIEETWYDWAMVHFEETNNLGEIMEYYYPSRLLGFITTNKTQEAVIQCSVNPIQWGTIQKNFIVEIQLGRNFNISSVIVPIKSIVHPLCVFPDDGDQTDKFFVVLPKRNWSRFFGNSMDIQPPGTNLYFKYEFVPATPATAVGKTQQPT